MTGRILEVELIGRVDESDRLVNLIHRIDWSDSVYIIQLKLTSQI